MLQRLRSRPILLALLALAVAAVLWAGWKGLRLYRLAMDLRGQASTLAGLASGDIEDFDLAQVHSQVQAARGSADALCGELALFQPLLARLGWVPRFGPLLASAYPAVEYAAALTAAGDELLTGLTPLLESPDGAPASSAGERLLIGLQAAEPHLASAEGHFERAVAARSGISLEALPASLAGPLARLDPLLPAAAPALQALQALPQALGAEQPRSYLLLAQNQDELRATGGFISGAGVLALHEGAIQAMELGDSYALDDLSKPYPAPPEPLRRYMQAGYWLLRDANWSPDFPTSATQALDLYQLSTGERPDGVVAFDQTAIQRLLAVLGPVEVPHLQETVTSENVIDFMRQSWGAAPGAEVEPDWWQHRKDFMADLGNALVDRAMQVDQPGTLMALVREAYKLLREKHFLLYFEEDRLQAALAALGLDGALRPGEGDFLLVVDSNLGFNKADPLIERLITYRVDLTQDAPSASLTLTYRHTFQGSVDCRHAAYVEQAVYKSLMERCYWDYLRVYLPAAADPISAHAPPVPAEWLLSGEPEDGSLQMQPGEAGTSMLSGLFVLPPGEQIQITAHYRLPASVLSTTAEGLWVYRLRVAKQAGTLGTPLRVEVRLPAGSLASDGGWKPAEPGVLVWEGRLWVDQELELTFREPQEGQE